LLFAYATVLCEAFYGEACLGFLVKKPVFRSLYLAALSLSLYLGAVYGVEGVCAATDCLLALMTQLNLALLLARAGRIVSLTKQAGLLREK